MKSQRNRAMEILSQSRIISSKQLSSEGIHRETIRRLLETGEIISIARGLYTSSQFIPDENFTFIVAQKIAPKGIICLLSALSFHEIGTQNPSEVWIAIPRGTRTPQVEDYPIQISLFSGEAYSNGIEEHTVDGVAIRVYSIAKTIADCFKYRNKIGLDVAIQALKDVIQNKRTSIEEILHFAKICRVEKVMKPYMESLV
jgi:predicted transcriptional regulator of viral defense system